MEKLLDTGKVRSIGYVFRCPPLSIYLSLTVCVRRVSNFSVKNLEILLKEASVVPAVNQASVSPLGPHKLVC